MRFPSDPDIAVRYAVIAALAVAGIGFVVWLEVSSQDREARNNAMPGCIAKLGSEAACKEHMSQFHRVCFNYNNKPAGRYTPRIFEAQGYLDCIVEGPDAWNARVQAENRRRRGAWRASGQTVP
jgi:hypothetical protein